MHQALNDCLTGWNDLGKAFCGYAGSTFVQSALLVMLLFALDVLLRQRVRAVFRYCVWLLVLLKLVLPPTLSLPTGIGYWVGHHLPVVTAVSERIFVPMERGRPERHPPTAAQASDALPAAEPSTEAREPAAPAAPAVVAPTSLTWQAVVLLFWIAGVLAFVALLLQRLRFVRGLVVASTPAGRELRDLLEQCCRQMSVHRPVGLRTLDTLPSPAVCGLRRPTILMPASLVEKLSSEGLRAALIHELAHIKRADLWVNAVQTFLQIIYFYNPFVWLANGIIRRTCEEAVDETVLVTLGGQAKNYSNALIDISEIAFWKADFGLRLVGVAESRRLLQGRIKHMLTRPIPKSTRIGTLGTIMILVVAAVLLPMARGTQVRQSGTSSLMDRLQKEEDPELAEMIRTAVANHQGASEKEILEITRRVTQSRAQILLLDTQIEEINRKIEATPGPGETREGLLRSKKELETKQMMEMANLREAMGIVPRLPFAAQSTANLKTFKLSPADGAEGVAVNDQELTWLAGDKVKAYKVYLGLDPANLTLLGQVEQVGAKVSHLKCNTKYYWRVDEVQADGSVVDGKVNVFTTGGLAAWWRLDEAKGTKAADSSGHHHDGKLLGSPLWQPKGGKMGGALQFDGAHDGVDTGWADDLATWTVAVWVKSPSAPRSAMVPSGPVHRQNNYQINWDHHNGESRGAAGVLIGSTWYRASFGSLDGGVWYHLVGTFDGQGLKAYKDGILISENLWASGRPLHEPATLKLGKNSVQEGGYFAGTIDEVSIFTYALSAEEVKALHDGKEPTALTAPPVSSNAKIVLAPLDTRARLEAVKRAKSPFGQLPTPSLNAWVSLQVLEQRVVVLDTLKEFSDAWFYLRHKAVGAFSEKETLDYLQGRLKDVKNLPMRIHIYYLSEKKPAAEALRQKIFALAYEANAERDTEVRLELSGWVGSGESPFYLREGKIRTFYPRAVRRPEGGPKFLTSGLVDPNDLEQHILWRLTKPKNVPLTFRIEYDEASYELAKQVANTAKAVAKRVGLTDLVSVAGILVDSVPESAFLGKWDALGSGVIQSVEIQPGGACQVTVGEGSQVLKAGTSVKGTWAWTVKQILLDIGDPLQGIKDYPPYRYRTTVNEEGNLVIERGEIWPQGSFMFTRPPRMIFKRVQ